MLCPSLLLQSLIKVAHTVLTRHAELDRSYWQPVAIPHLQVRQCAGQFGAQPGWHLLPLMLGPWVEQPTMPPCIC
jgi:hypothetical protein